MLQYSMRKVVKTPEIAGTFVLAGESREVLTEIETIETVETGSVKEWLTGTTCSVYCSHFLSAWGDRMWQFAVALFLIEISPGSLQLTAIYGLSSGGAILLLAPLIGEWIDRNPRLRAARLTLVLQNLSVILCAVLICLLILFKHWADALWDGWLTTLWHAGIIVVAVVANLSSLGNNIAVQKDWIVEICRRDNDKLASMSAVLRRIDLATKILAPIATGQIMTFASMLIGAIFIAGWNLISMFVEYVLLWKVYISTPALAVKKQRGEKDDGPDQDGEVGQNLTGDMDDVPLTNIQRSSESMEDENDPSDNTKVAVNNSDDTLTTQNEASTLANQTEDDAISANQNEADPLTNQKEENTSLNQNTEEPEHKSPTVEGTSENLKLKETDKDLVCVISTTTKTDTNEKKEGCCAHDGCCYKVFGAFVILFKGWRTYMRYRVALAGFGLAILYLTVLGFDNVTTGYAYSQGLTESILGFLMAAGAVIGILGTLAYPRIRRRLGLARTGLYSFSCQIFCLTLCVGSIWAPGSPFDPISWRETRILHNPLVPCANVTTTPSITVALATTKTSHSDWSTNVSLPLYKPTTANNNNNSGDPLCREEGYGVRVPHSYLSIALLMAGIITARFGLWITDLTVTQLMLENVKETERGIVNGVQQSLQQLMDMLKFALVVGLPQPELFGMLTIVSFLAVSTGGVFYAAYSRKVRGHLFHIDKLTCSIVANGNGNHPPVGDTYSAEMGNSPEKSSTPPAV